MEYNLPVGMPVKSILVVEDNAGVRNTTRLLLEASGYAVSVASGGVEAIRMLRRGPVDLVITDLLMPDMDGIELINALHKDFAGIRVVAMSGGGVLDAEFYLTMAKRLRADSLLKKPFTRDELLMAIEAIEAGSLSSAPPRVA
ncbi:MAG: response regulator [Opitutaceae bacterium]